LRGATLADVWRGLAIAIALVFAVLLLMPIGAYPAAYRPN
jgi:hypothetical protein